MEAVTAKYGKILVHASDGTNKPFFPVTTTTQVINSETGEPLSGSITSLTTMITNLAHDVSTLENNL